MKTLIPLSLAVAAVAFVGCSTTPPPAAPNTLTEAEKLQGWHLAWDGETLDGWVGVKKGCKAPPDKGWIIEDGVLTVLPCKRINAQGKWEDLPADQAKLGGGGDIVTAAKFTDFVFKVDFKLTRAANSGIKYYYDETLNGGTTLEFQLLDGEHPDAKLGVDGNRRIGSLYDMMPAHADRYAKPVGEWNTAMLVSKGGHIEHWLNGHKVLEYERGGEAFMTAFKKSKYVKSNQNGKWGLTPSGRILLQDHHDSKVSFRNIKFKRL